MEEKEYIFTQEDLEFIQNLLPEEVQVFLRNDNKTMEVRYNKKNKYVEDAIFRFNPDLYKEIEKYFSKIGKVTFNNNKSCWWIFY